MDLAEKAERPRLVSPFLLGSAQLERSFRRSDGVIATGVQQIGFAESGDPHGLAEDQSDGVALLYALFRQADALDGSARERSRVAEERGGDGDQMGKVGRTTEREGALEHRQGLRDVSAAEVHVTEAEMNKGEAVGMPDGFGQPHRFVTTGDSLREAFDDATRAEKELFDVSPSPPVTVGLERLHPAIYSKCRPLYESAAYAEAAEKGFKVVRDRLRELTG